MLDGRGLALIAIRSTRCRATFSGKRAGMGQTLGELVEIIRIGQRRPVPLAALADHRACLMKPPAEEKLAAGGPQELH